MNRTQAVVGSKRRVFAGTATQTVGGLTRADLMRNKRGKIVSRKKHAQGVRMMLGRKGIFKPFRR